MLYILEGIDNNGHFSDLTVNSKKPLEARFQPDLLHGVTVLTSEGQDRATMKDDEIPLTLIPYYAWGHREISPMAVWIGK